MTIFFADKDVSYYLEEETSEVWENLKEDIVERINFARTDVSELLRINMQSLSLIIFIYII